MKQGRIALVYLLLLLHSGCKQDDVESFLTRSPDKFNDEINSGRSGQQDWAKDPILISYRLFVADPANGKIIVECENESVDDVVVTVTEEGPGDDSINGEKRIVRFRRTGTDWNIIEIKLGFKCWKSRGHTNYSGQPCS